MIPLFFLVIAAFVSGTVLSISFPIGVRFSFLDLSLVLFVVGSSVNHFPTREELKRYASLFGPFILIALISLFLQLEELRSDQIGTSSLYLLRFILYSSLVIFTARKPICHIALPGLWVGGVLVAVLGLIQYMLYPNLRNLSYLGWDPHEYRIFSTMLDPNFTGIILVLTIFLCINLYQNYHKNTLWRIFVIGALGVSFVTLLLTYSRGSFIALTVGVMIWLLLQKKIHYFLGFIGVLLIGLLLLPKPGGEGVDLFRVMSVEARIENSREALKLFMRKPIFGWGFNTIRFVKDETAVVPGTTAVSHSGAGFHNSWLFILATTGIVGFFAYLWIWKELFRLVLLKLKQRLVGQLFLVSAVTVFTHSLFDNSLFFPQVMMWLWIVTGVVGGRDSQGW